jgi:hypothetical protein
MEQIFPLKQKRLEWATQGLLEEYGAP